MKIKSQRDFFAGLMFMAVGGAFAWGATNYTVGQAARMGQDTKTSLDLLVLGPLRLRQAGVTGGQEDRDPGDGMAEEGSPDPAGGASRVAHEGVGGVDGQVAEALDALPARASLRRDACARAVHQVADAAPGAVPGGVPQERVNVLLPRGGVVQLGGFVGWRAAVGEDAGTACPAGGSGRATRMGWGGT